MRTLITNNLTGTTEEIEIEEVEDDFPEIEIPQTELQAPTMEQMAIALMQTQTELEDAQIALDFLLMGGI